MLELFSFLQLHQCFCEKKIMRILWVDGYLTPSALHRIGKLVCNVGFVHLWLGSASSGVAASFVHLVHISQLQKGSGEA